MPLYRIFTQKYFLMNITYIFNSLSGVLILGGTNLDAPEATISNVLLSTDYTLLSGTSMSCPHISGIAALLKAAHPEWSPAAIQSAIMTTSNQLDNTNQPIKDMGFGYMVADPLGYGAGQVDANRALDPELVYDGSIQDHVNLVCSMNFISEQTKTIIKSSYNCSTPSSDLNYPSFIALYDFEERGIALNRKFKRTGTNVGRGAATYKLKLEIPNGSTISISSNTFDNFPTQHGSVTWIEDGGKHTVRSPIVVAPGFDNFR